MPAMKSNEVQDWFKNITLENGQELYNAIEANYPDFQAIAKLLENPNIDVNWKDEHGTNALIEASWDYSTLVRQLLNSGADVNTKTDTGQTALMQASWWGKPEVVRDLLIAGADPLIVSEDKFIARDFAYTRRGWTSETTRRNDEVRKLLESAEKRQKEKVARK